MEVDEKNYDIENEFPEESADDVTAISNSILNSIKKQLGIDPSIKSFDVDIIININSAIATLAQLGVGPEDGYFIVDEKNTYQEYIGDSISMYQQIKMYLYLKTKIVFDPPSSSYVLESFKEQAKELEWRLQRLSEKIKGLESG